jgi:hypothetical protein
MEQNVTAWRPIGLYIRKPKLYINTNLQKNLKLEVLLDENDLYAMW